MVLASACAPSIVTTSGPCDFVAERTHDGRTLKLLTVVDEYTRECLAILVQRRITSHEVLMTLSDLFLEYGIPEHIRSDNGPEFVARAVREWLGELGVTTLFIEPASPWENGYIESFNGKLRDELLNGEIFHTLKEGADPDRQLAAALQRPASAQLAGQPAAGAGDDRLPGLLAR
jgi:transposase InsO family protein